MKFAKELNEELVPEWRVKYLDYKLGKKKVKAIRRALQRTNRTPTRRPDTYYETPSQDLQPNASTSATRFPLNYNGSPSAHMPEQLPLRTPGSRFSNTIGGYGSIVSEPPLENVTRLPSLQLPDPAIDPDRAGTQQKHQQRLLSNTDQSPLPRQGTSDRPVKPPPYSVINNKGNPKRLYSTGDVPSKTAKFFKRVFTSGDLESSGRSYQSSISDEVTEKEDEFFEFLDSELNKIESFYKEKEVEATHRLQALRQQLHMMRDQRTAQMMTAKRAKSPERDRSQPNSYLNVIPNTKWAHAIVGKQHFGKNSRALATLQTPKTPGPMDPQSIIGRRDFVQRPESVNVPYRSAKRKLKLALQEFYRGLELLKSYAYLNRKAFRKINKKFDKSINMRPTLRYMSEKVNKAYFVQSEVIEGHMVTVEDLYARYIEGGNRKIAVTKLRGKNHSHDFSPNTFRIGMLLAAGFVSSIQGLILAIRLLGDTDNTVRLNTSYLLQIYGGYFLIVFHYMLFCLDCMIWTRAKINYAFVFEFDTRHVLNWRQLAEWRLLLAGLYPVEFRDFFLGDMYCSQTYAMGNIELFFCLYATAWNNPPTCNSSNSRLLGFFTTLPAIWRGLQCLRRYRDTKNIFPHLVNFGKYTFSILFYMTLSLYRIDKQIGYQVPFIVFGAANAIYCSIWDIAMDWSLGNVYASHTLLRDILAFRRAWLYYVAIVIDVVIRFNWIFYAIFINDIQHSASLSFFVSLTEICRRGIWTIFRVENEHCTNVHMFRALRDIPLPYQVEEEMGETPAGALDGEQGEEEQPIAQGNAPSPLPAADDVDLEASLAKTLALRARRPTSSRAMSRVGTLMATAHSQDFQRRRPTDPLGGPAGGSAFHDLDDTTDEEDEKEDESPSREEHSFLDSDIPDPPVDRNSPHSQEH
ncbi:putative signal transduction protein Syg1 [Talaromyces proteolyticus]|uniref:Signal transduction protein Syg1 n=1 Tax=Talaromyces proteolyticus TaxID=1131652 RepID=A0AAD4Q104_9EURO|nr:putative signal transduction protein Syg1 [Talaromyces proteolyticus]KAH8701764.1 putative signal transduction protein Syg1 [Talaromyces proteolyticus]